MKTRVWKVLWLVAVTTSMAVLLNRPAQAHFVFVVAERQGSSMEARVFFSESAQAAADRMPDKIATTRLGWRTIGDGGLTALPTQTGEREGQPLLIAPLDSESPGSLEAVCDYGVYKSLLLVYYAKHLMIERLDQLKPVSELSDLSLDIEARGIADGGLELTVAWQRRPLAGASVVLSDPDGRETETTSDTAGRVRLIPTGPGLYAVRAHHVQPDVRGQVGDASYDSAHHYATLTVRLGDAQLAELVPNRAELPKLTEGLASFGAAICDDWLYVYGGHIGTAHDHSRDNLSNHFRRVRLGTNEWEELPMQTPLQGLALISDDRFVYRIGGVTALNPAGSPADLHSASDVARFDPDQQVWASLPSLPAGRSSHDAVLIGSRVFVVGGWDLEGDEEGSWHSTSLMLDLADETPGWSQLPAQPFRRRALAAGQYQGKLYAIGGMNAEHAVDRTVDVFDPQNGTWAVGPQLPGEGMNGFGVAAWHDGRRLYVSGSNGSVYRLSDDAQRWEPAATLRQPRFFHRLLAEGPESLFVLGGASSEGHLRDSEWITPAVVQSTDSPRRPEE